MDDNYIFYIKNNKMEFDPIVFNNAEIIVNYSTFNEKYNNLSICNLNQTIIKCNISDNLDENNDIRIEEVFPFTLNRIIYTFKNYNNLTTYNIQVSKIEKIICENQNYQFKIIIEKSTISRLFNFTLNVSFINENEK